MNDTGSGNPGKSEEPDETMEAPSTGDDKLPEQAMSIASDSSVPTKVISKVKQEPKKVSYHRERCHHSACQKKLSLTDYPCKCGIIFCPKHRYAEEHDCTHDYKAEFQEKWRNDQKKDYVSHYSYSDGAGGGSNTAF